LLVIYGAIAGTIARAVWARGAWRANPLAVATAGIFVTCGLHHGVHGIHLLTMSGHMGSMVRDAFDNWPLALLDLVTAGVGAWYFSLRSRYPALVRGAALFEDLRQRRHDALALNDAVVQNLTVAKLQIELGHHDAGLDAIDEALSSTQRMLTELLGEAGTLAGPGDGRGVSAR
jgi:hypothetical protein